MWHGGAGRGYNWNRKITGFYYLLFTYRDYNAYWATKWGLAQNRQLFQKTNFFKDCQKSFFVNFSLMFASQHIVQNKSREYNYNERHKWVVPNSN